ncbi:MAG: lipopolysaccharide biosynthesis protein [Steroidobacteraceae bacterium]
MNPLNRGAGSHLLLYGIGSLTKQLATVVMLPIYTYYLSPADYGAVEIVSLIVSSMSLIAGMNLGEGLFRYYHEREDLGGGRKAVASALGLAFGLNLLGTILLLILSPVLASQFLSNSDLWYLVAICAATLVSESCVSIVTCHMRAEQNAWHFFWTGIARLILQVGFNVFFVIYLRLGVLGVFLGLLASSVLLALAILPYSIRRVGFSVSVASARLLLVFGGPLVLANVAQFYLGAIDRFFLEHFQDLASVGIYALAARLAQSFLTLIYEPFEQIWDPEKYRIWRAGRNIEPFQRVFRLLTSILVICGVGISILAPEIFALLTSKPFAFAGVVAPVLVASSICTALTRFARFGSLAEGKTGNVYKAALVSATVMTLMLFVLTPQFGAMGAATAVVGAAVVRVFVEDRMARRLVNLRLPWGSFLVVAGVGILVALGCFQLGPISPGNIAIKVTCVIALAGAIWWSPYLGYAERHLVLTLIRPRSLKSRL